MLVRKLESIETGLNCLESADYAYGT